MSDADDPKFDGFISYSHADKAFGEQLQNWLEGFRPQASIRERPLRIFRDDVELGAVSVLSDAIQSALERSAALIVVASQNASNSAWVAKEIESFAKISQNRPLILIAPPEGGLSAAQAHAFFAGLWRKACGRGIEPFVADCSVVGEEHAFLQVASGLLHCDLGDLLDRHAQQRGREVARVSEALALAYADPIRRDAVDENTDRLLKLIASYCLDASDWSFSHAPELARAARGALANKRLRLVVRPTDDEKIYSAVLNPDGSCLAMCRGYYADVRNVSTGKRLFAPAYRAWRANLASVVGAGRGVEVRAQLLWLDKNNLVINDFVSIRQLDLRSGELRLLADAKQHQPFVACAVSQNGRFLVAVEGQFTQSMSTSMTALDELNYRRSNTLSSAPEVSVYDLETARRVFAFHRQVRPFGNDVDLVVNVCASGERVILSQGDVLQLYEMKQRKFEERKITRSRLPHYYYDAAGWLHLRREEESSEALDHRIEVHDAFPAGSSSVRILQTDTTVTALNAATGDLLWSVYAEGFEMPVVNRAGNLGGIRV